MKLFGKKKKQEPIDDRTQLEKTFEEKGQEIGKAAGEIAQKGVNKFHEIKERLDEEGKLDKVYEVTEKATEKTKEVIDKVTVKTKEVFDKQNKKNGDDV